MFGFCFNKCLNWALNGIWAQATTISKAFSSYGTINRTKSNETKRIGTAKLDWHRNIYIFVYVCLYVPLNH